MTPSNDGKAKKAKPVLAWGLLFNEGLSPITYCMKYKAIDDSEWFDSKPRVVRVEIRPYRPTKKRKVSSQEVKPRKRKK